jgi:acetyltransferase-like isoleucine patch superfamily enzyme
MKKLIIFGSGVVAKLAYFLFTRDGNYLPICFTVDNEYKTRDSFNNLPLIPFNKITELYPPESHEMFVAIGPSAMNSKREKKFIEVKSEGYKMAKYVSPHSLCYSEVGENSLIADHVSINPFSKIGYNNFFWEYSLISHDSTVMNNCYFGPRSIVSSYSVIQNNVIIGANSTIKSKVTISHKTLVGSSCYISKNTTSESVFGRNCSKFLGEISSRIDISD